jgi:hypothetical protein
MSYVTVMLPLRYRYVTFCRVWRDKSDYQISDSSGKFLDKIDEVGDVTVILCLLCNGYIYVATNFRVCDMCVMCIDVYGVSTM